MRHREKLIRASCVTQIKDMRRSSGAWGTVNNLARGWSKTGQVRAGHAHRRFHMNRFFRIEPENNFAPIQIFTLLGLHSSNLLTFYKCHV